MLTTGPRGTNDILPGEVEKWQYLETEIREICREYGYAEIRTPIFEHTELFQRGVGETTDIVEKEMYTFIDRGNRSITLRPENTAPAVRAFLEHKLQSQPQPTKLFYIGPMFRYDRPQAGRFRQFHQFGVEVFGSNDPMIDAEVIAMPMDLYRRLGLTGLELHINSVGCPVCRVEHRQALQAHLRPYLAEFCANCQSRFERNPMRILDCKSDNCQKLSRQSPTITRYLCPDCAAHFAKVQKYLDLLNIPYLVDERLVRGLDYYTNTAFEIVAKAIGAQSSIGGGGRYNGLVEQCGGPSLPGIGYALGLERVLLTLEQQKIKLPVESDFDVFIAALGEEARNRVFPVLFELRRLGVRADMDYLGRSLKAQMKYANKYQTKYTVIVGDSELSRDVAVVRTMATGAQEELPLNELAEQLLTRLETDFTRELAEI